MTDALAQLRHAAEILPAGTTLTLTREALLEALNDVTTGTDLTVPAVAEHFSRSRSCIRSWLECGLLRGYKLRGREWRISRLAIADFEERERRGESRRQTSHGGAADLSAWRKARSA